MTSAKSSSRPGGTRRHARSSASSPLSACATRPRPTGPMARGAATPHRPQGPLTTTPSTRTPRTASPRRPARETLRGALRASKGKPCPSSRTSRCSSPGRLRTASMPGLSCECWSGGCRRNYGRRGQLDPRHSVGVRGSRPPRQHHRPLHEQADRPATCGRALRARRDNPAPLCPVRHDHRRLLKARPGSQLPV